MDGFLAGLGGGGYLGRGPPGQCPPLDTLKAREARLGWSGLPAGAAVHLASIGRGFC